MKPQFFNSQFELRKWFMERHDTTTEVWIGFYKKNSGKMSVSYVESVDEALCFGWIDGIRKKIDNIRYANRFTPRKRKSNWSKINVENAKRLIKSGAMTKSGLSKINEAKADGRWKKAYDSFGNATPPVDFMKEMSLNKKAKAFFKTLNKTNLYSISYRLQTAKKPETRKKRIKTIIKMLEQGETFH